MTIQTNISYIYLRGIGRKYGLNKLIRSFLNRTATYEEQFDRELLAHIRESDCVWDVGANIGYYSRRFSDRVGHNGLIIALEPSSQNFQRLADSVRQYANIRPLQIALSDQTGRSGFRQGDDEVGATSALDESSRDHLVDVKRGDELVASSSAPFPNVIKIDVEGFELEVVRGLGQLLGRGTALRAIAIEVHFGLLQARGIATAPKTIEELLRSNSFQCVWPDSSHLIASRD